MKRCRSDLDADEERTSFTDRPMTSTFSPPTSSSQQTVSTSPNSTTFVSCPSNNNRKRRKVRVQHIYLDPSEDSDAEPGAGSRALAVDGESEPSEGIE